LGGGKGIGRTHGRRQHAETGVGHGEVKIIGATTIEEYHEYICRDAALERRFEEIRLQEPAGELLDRMINTQVEGLQRYHGIKISASVIRKTVELTDRYLSNRRQPDKSVDLLDTSSVVAASAGRTTLTEHDLLETLARMIGRPIGMLTGGDVAGLKTMANRLKERIVGQDEARRADGCIPTARA